jgi:hypothetical protein
MNGCGLKMFKMKVQVELFLYLLLMAHRETEVVTAYFLNLGTIGGEWSA